MYFSQASDFLPTTAIIVLDKFQLKHISWTAKRQAHNSFNQCLHMLSFFFIIHFLSWTIESQNYSIWAAIKPPKFNFSYELHYYFIAFNWVIYSWSLCSQTPPTIYLLSLILRSYRCRLGAGQQFQHRNKLRRFAFLISQWRVVQLKASWRQAGHKEHGEEMCSRHQKRDEKRCVQGTGTQKRGGRRAHMAVAQLHMQLLHGKQ